MFVFSSKRRRRRRRNKLVKKKKNKKKRKTKRKNPFLTMDGRESRRQRRDRESENGSLIIYYSGRSWQTHTHTVDTLFSTIQTRTHTRGRAKFLVGRVVAGQHITSRLSIDTDSPAVTPYKIYTEKGERKRERDGYYYYDYCYYSSELFGAGAEKNK